jgi:hypothetical protein
MSEKVKVTKEQAKAIEYLLSKKSSYHGNISQVVKDHAECNCDWCGDSSYINLMPLDTLIRALYIGYEVEKSNEEKAVEWMVRNSAFTGARCEWYINRIAKILNGEEPDA